MPHETQNNIIEYLQDKDENLTTRAVIDIINKIDFSVDCYKQFLEV